MSVSVFEAEFMLFALLLWLKHELFSQPDGFPGDEHLGRLDLAASLQGAYKTLTVLAGKLPDL